MAWRVSAEAGLPCSMRWIVRSGTPPPCGGLLRCVVSLAFCSSAPPYTTFIPRSVQKRCAEEPRAKTQRSRKAGEAAGAFEGEELDGEAQLGAASWPIRIRWGHGAVAVSWPP